MRLVYENDQTREVKLNDRVTIDGRGDALVDYFRPPHKPASEGQVTVKWVSTKPDSNFPKVGETSTYYVSVIGAVWIEREDRQDDDEIEIVEIQKDTKPVEEGDTWDILKRDELKFAAVHDNDSDWVLYSPDVESCEANSQEQMDRIAALVNQAPRMLRVLRELRSTAYEYLDDEALKMLGQLDHIN